MADQVEKIDVRGAVRFTLGGVALKLQPEFSNLARIETTLGKSAVGILARAMSGDVSVVEIAKIVIACAAPDGDHKLPKPWNHIDVGQMMMDEGYAQFVGHVITFLGAALSAKPAKRVDGGSEDSGE